MVYKLTDCLSQLIEQIEALHRDDLLSLPLLSVVPKSELPLLYVPHEYQNGMVVVALLTFTVEIELENLQKV